MLELTARFFIIGALAFGGGQAALPQFLETMLERKWLGDKTGGGFYKKERGADGTWKPAKLALIRLQRVRDAWKKHAALTLRGGDALRLAQTVGDWRDALADGSEPDASNDDD